MDVPLNKKETIALLDNGVAQLLFVDDIIDQLYKIPSNILSCCINHRFYNEHLFNRLIQILEQWNQNQTILTHSTRFSFLRKFL